MNHQVVYKLSHHHTTNYVNLFGEIVKILNAY